MNVEKNHKASKDDIGMVSNVIRERLIDEKDKTRSIDKVIRMSEASLGVQI